MNPTNATAKSPKSEVFRTPPVILSYPALFEPRLPGPNATKPIYSCALVFPAETPPEVRKNLDALIDACGREKLGAKYDSLKRSGKLKLPIHPTTEEEEAKGYPPGSFFINCRSDSAPGIVGPVAGVDGKPTEITNPLELYPGCIVRATINFYGFNAGGGQGVGTGLRNIQKIKEGTRLDNRKKAKDDFDPIAEAEMDDALL